MNRFAIVEVEDGLTIVALPADRTPEEAAVDAGGILVDPGPYPTFEAAGDALAELAVAAEEEEQSNPVD